MDGVGAAGLKHAVHGLKTALKNSGLEAATKTVADARRIAEEATSSPLEAAPGSEEATGKSAEPEALPTPGRGLGKHVDIRV